MFSSIWPMDRKLSGATTPSQSGTGRDGNKGVVHISWSSSITGASPSDCLGGILPLSRDVISVFCCPGRQCQRKYFTLKLKVKLATVVDGDLRGPFSIATTLGCRGRHYSFPGLLHFILDTYLIMLSVKQGGSKYHFLKVFGMTRLGIEPRSPGPLANTLPTGSMGRFTLIYRSKNERKEHLLKDSVHMLYIP